MKKSMYQNLAAGIASALTSLANLPIPVQAPVIDNSLEARVSEGKLPTDEAYKTTKISDMKERRNYASGAIERDVPQNQLSGLFSTVYGKFVPSSNAISNAYGPEISQSRKTWTAYHEEYHSFHQLLERDPDIEKDEQKADAYALAKTGKSFRILGIHNGLPVG